MSEPKDKTEKGKAKRSAKPKRSADAAPAKPSAETPSKDPKSVLVNDEIPLGPRMEGGAEKAAKTAVRLSPYSARTTATPKTVNLRESMMSGAERRYQRDVLKGEGLFEAITLKLPGGSRYTPDFLTIDDGVPTLHEVKGSYRLGSEGRAHTAFHEAAARFSGIFRFVWATLEKGGRWNVKATIERQNTQLGEGR